MTTRYERRQKLGKKLGVEIKGVPLHMLKKMHDQKFPKIETPKPQAVKGAKDKVKLTSGDIDASKFPPADLCDRNGKPLHGFALQKRVEKLARTGDAPENTAVVTTTPVTDSIDVVRFEAVEKSVGEMKSILETLVSAVSQPTK